MPLRKAFGHADLQARVDRRAKVARPCENRRDLGPPRVESVPGDRQERGVIPLDRPFARAGARVQDLDDPLAIVEALERRVAVALQKRRVARPPVGLAFPIPEHAERHAAQRVAARVPGLTSLFPRHPSLAIVRVERRDFLRPARRQDQSAPVVHRPPLDLSCRGDQPRVVFEPIAAVGLLAQARRGRELIRTHRPAPRRRGQRGRA